MAEAAEPPPKKSKFYCQSCDVEFSFKSKYDRHLSSKSHSKFVEACQEFSESSQISTMHNIEDESEVNLFTGEGCSDLFYDGLYECGVQNSDHSYESDTEDVDVDSFTTLTSEMDTVSSDFFPFNSKHHALLFFLCYSPRPIGETNLQFIWYILHGLDHSLPSLAMIKKFQLPKFTEPKKFVGTSGIPFYVNDVLSSIKMSLGNPNTAKLLHRYPEIPSNYLSELYHGEVWFNDQRMQSISATFKRIVYYLNDFVSIEYNGQHNVLAKILKFYQKEGEDTIFMEVDLLYNIDQVWKQFPEVSGMYVDDGTRILVFSTEIPINSIEKSASCPLNLLHLNNSTMKLISFTTIEYCNYILPHPKKELAKGRPIIVIPLVLFTDDTSGNKSKKWNKFEWWGFTLAGLPQAESHKPQHVQFISCSNVVPLLEMAGPITQQFICAENGFDAFDASLDTDVFVIAPILLLAADNVRHSELLNHMGSKALKFCRMCMVDRKSPTSLSNARTKQLTINQLEDIAKAETETKKKELRTLYGIKEPVTVNPMFDLNVDLHSSTPVETLHSILLGTCKYLLRTFMSSRNKTDKKKILARMSSLNQSGFSTKVLGNVCYYYQSFVARDFKGWMQQAVFVLAPFLSSDQEKVWLLLSKVFKIAYCERLSKASISVYQNTCQDLVSEISRTYPEHMERIKVHLLLHLPDDIRKFSHPSCFNTERFEAFNSYIRNQNVYSNKHAPSRDIAHNLAVISYLRFWCSSDQTRYFSVNIIIVMLSR